MRIRILPLVSVLLLVPAVSAGYESVAPPAAARAWLGHWKTNQGTFGFEAITNCYRGADIVGGENCGVTGTWDQPGGKGSVPIHGTIFLGPKYKGEVFQGCFDLPNLIPPNHCTFNDGGEISLDRAGKRITHGYWKACGLGANCKSHHPITGRRVSGGGGGGCHKSRGAATAAACGSKEIVNFNVTVDGFPDKPDARYLPEDLATVDIQSKGTVLESEAGGSFKASGRLDMTLTYINPIVTPHVQEKHVRLRLRELANYVEGPDRRRVTVIGDVTSSSTHDDCPEGAVVEIRLTISGDKRALAFDGFDGLPNRCLSTRTVVWGPNKVKKASISTPTPA